MGYQMADEVLELTEAEEEQNLNAEDDQEQVDGEADDLVIPTFGEEEDAPPPEDSSVIREMRAKLREQASELTELRNSVAPKPIEVGEKPTLESCEYDEGAYETELLAWQGRKAEAEKQNVTQTEQKAAQEKMWADRQTRYEARKSKLPAEFADYEAEVTHKLPFTHQGVIAASHKSAELVYALGRNPAKLAEISKITDPIEFALALGEMQGQLQMRSKAPAPDSALSGNASASSSADKTLERLEREAEKSNDRTKVIEYKDSLKAKK